MPTKKKVSKKAPARKKVIKKKVARRIASPDITDQMAVELFLTIVEYACKGVRAEMRENMRGRRVRQARGFMAPMARRKKPR